MFFLILTTCILGCENDFQDSSKNDESINLVNRFKLINGVLSVDSREEFITIHDLYKNNISFQNEFNITVKNLQDKGFRPLEPLLDNNDSQKIEDFVKRKLERLHKRDLDFGIGGALNAKVESEEPEVDLDDELIKDPFLASLLNEDREIFIGNKLYKYSEIGLLICGDDSKTLDDDKLFLDDYLESLTPTDRISIINEKLMAPDPCSQGIKHLTSEIDLFQDISMCDYGGGTSNTGQSTLASPTLAPAADLVKQNLPVCNVQANSLWELVFGVSDGCISEMNGNKRVKTKFWNQNYFLFSSIGCKVKFQKHVEHWWASWWEKSYAEKLELGTNYVTYDYNFNVPAFNVDQYNQETKFFEYNGTKYNSYGGVITTIPTGLGTFVFDTESDQSIMNIEIFGHHVTNSEINQVIDFAVMQCVNGIQNWTVKSEITNKINTGQIKYNIINAVPFDSKVKMITKGVRWASNNENMIVHYFDMNFLFSWSSEYDDFLDYLKGLSGSTEYENVSADIYGAAYNEGQWGGSRILFNAN